MKALVITGVSKVELQELEVPKYKTDEVLIKVKYCGICGSDLPRALDGGVHSFPIVVGHEFSGQIVEVGAAVESVKVGDRVTAGALLPCGKCEACQQGRPAMCTNYGFIGSRQNGAMAEYVAVKAQNVVKLPDEVDYKEGAMIEPLTVALHGIQRVNIKAGATALVFGAGTIGLLALQCLKAVGAGKVYMVDVVDKKLELAKKLGADDVINSMNVDLNEYLSQNGKPEIVVENSGSPIAQAQCLEIVKKCGSVVYIGTATRDLILKPETFEKILRGELNITGSWMSYSAPYPGYEWTTAVEYIKEKKIDLKSMITNVYKLEDGVIPFEIMRDKNACATKVLFEI
ncbi:galactitol-1-phosphate 5-dehydrogenase [uncultured Clostridium sp.]|uniref:galactitol-1-phosphate 5-dehydrogenase n=1 Tax=uncultured Clostridium sp. TaxID=59620 RepID=UPI0028E21E1F|nr:galactitol-1-phosphate 5-dehydrogenase [uncultured Clostridium sp.]